MTDGQHGRNRFGAYAAALVAGLVAVYFLRYVLLPFVIAAAIAYIVNPGVVRMQRRFAIRRWLAGFMVFVLVVCAFAGVAIWVGLPVWHDVRDIVLALPDSLHKSFVQLLHGQPIRLFGETLDADRLTVAVLNGLRSFFSAPANAADVALGAIALLMGVTLTVVLMFYFIVFGDGLLRGVTGLFPPRLRPGFSAFLRRLDPILGAYLRGVAAIAIYAIVFAALGLKFLLHVPHPLFFAVLSGLLELLPVIGPIAAALIVGAVVVQQASLWLVFAYGAYLTALRLSIDQLVGPLLLGRITALHPTVVIFALLAGGSVFGAVGLLLAVPVAVTVKIMLATATAPG